MSAVNMLNVCFTNEWTLFVTQILIWSHSVCTNKTILKVLTSHKTIYPEIKKWMHNVKL